MWMQRACECDYATRWNVLAEGEDSEPQGDTKVLLSIAGAQDNVGRRRQLLSRRPKWDEWMDNKRMELLERRVQQSEWGKKCSRRWRSGGQRHIQRRAKALSCWKLPAAVRHHWIEFWDSTGIRRCASNACWIWKEWRAWVHQQPYVGREGMFDNFSIKSPSLYACMVPEGHCPQIMLKNRMLCPSRARLGWLHLWRHWISWGVQRMGVGYAILCRSYSGRHFH